MPASRTRRLGESPVDAGRWRMPWHARLARRAVARRLATIRHGDLQIVDPTGSRRFGRADDETGLHARVEVQDARFWTDVALGGLVGAGESYMDGAWSCERLTELIRIMIRNRDSAERVEGGAAVLTGLGRRWLHALRANTRRGSRRNIAAHYDLGNDFFALFLDPTMTYSCGFFSRDDATLEEASRSKYDLICRKLELSPRHRVVEIGGGWGGFALHAAREYGCHVTTTTISARQHDLARRRVARAGLANRVTVLREDYRDLPRRVEGRFDRLVSIEMIEAVGYRRLDRFFEVCRELLEPDGSMLLQAIVIDDRWFEEYRRSVDFIRRHVFPGGCLPSPGALSASISRAGGLRNVHVQDITPHYPPTLRLWRRRLTEATDRARELLYPDRLLRMWDFYLCYCEAGFLERTTGDLQLLLDRPDARRSGPVPEA